MEIREADRDLDTLLCLSMLLLKLTDLSLSLFPQNAPILILSGFENGLMCELILKIRQTEQVF